MLGDHVLQNVNLLLTISDAIIPGEGHVGIYVHYVPILDDPHVVHVYPLTTAVALYETDYLSKKRCVCLIHNAGERFTDNAISGNYNYNSKDQGYCTIEPLPTRENKEYEAQDNGKCGIGVYPDMLTCSLDC